MKTVSTKFASRNFGKIATVAQNEPIVIARRGRKHCVVMSYRQFESCEAIVEQVVSDRLAHSLQRAIEKFERGEGRTGRRILENLNGLWSAAGLRSIRPR